MDEQWKSGVLTDEQKLKSDPKRFLAEILPEDGNPGLTVTIKLWDYSCVQNAAQQLVLLYEYVEAPQAKPWEEETYNFDALSSRWFILGRGNKAVQSKIASIKGQSQKRKREIEDHDAEVERAKKQKIEDALAKTKDWDVTGQWRIDFPYVAKNHGTGPDDLTLDIYQEETRKGCQMYAAFDFAATKGVMRFERQKGESRKPFDASLVPAGSQADEKDSQDSHDEYDEYGDRDRRSPTPEAFYLGKTAEVTPNHTDWDFRWRGEEMGEGVIEVTSDKTLYSMTFCGPRGFTLKGTFGGGIFPKCTFTGKKIGGFGPKSVLDIVQEWTDRNERAYDYACSHRWG